MGNDTLFGTACDLYEEGKYQEAFAKFLQAAKQGDTSCMVHVASMYTCGEGVECDYDQAIEWELKAIESGDVTAMNNVGISYRIKGDIIKSKHWLEKSLEAGEDGSALELAKLYMVSEKETDKVKTYLAKVISSKNVCEAEVEEAQQLLEKL